MSDVTARLAKALWDSSHPTHIDARQIARDILPVVREYGDQRAAEELEAAAAVMFWPNSQNCGPELRARAAALRGQTP